MTAKLREWTFSLQDLSAVADEVKNILNQSKVKPFVLWLTGDLGAGKTTFAGALLHSLGVPASVPILSPTYTYLTEYESEQKKFAHMDLYRLVHGDSDSIESLLAGRVYDGIIVEWPERAADSPLIEMTHELKLNQLLQGDSRHMQLWT